MGRQILFHALKDDCEQLFSFIRGHEAVNVVERDAETEELVDLDMPCNAKSVLILWKKEAGTVLRRHYIARATRPYFSVPYSAGLEFSRSITTEWNGHPGLTQGRLYFNTDRVNEPLARWYSRIARWIRARWTRCPVGLSGYVGPSALNWHEDGGLLLPIFRPPDTPEWRNFFSRQLGR